MNPYQLQQMQQAALIASQHKSSLALHHHYSSHHNQHTQAQHPHQPSHTSSSSSTSSNSHSRPIVERGASWSYNETRILLSLWGQDMVQRQLTNSKRTRHVWEKIAERIREHGFERTADQVRTRVFNMIAEYRRILKNPSPERKKKCIFFDALHKIYQAKDTNGVKAALNNYEEDYNLDPIDFSMSDENHDQNVTDGEDGSGNENEEKEIFAYDMSPSAALANGHSNCANGNTNLDPAGDTDSIGENEVEPRSNNGPGPSLYGHPCKRLRADSSLSNSLLNNSHPSNSQLHQSMYLNPGNSSSLDATASALLVDRMFNHLAKETEVMREWVQLERERLKDEIERRKNECEREERREAAFLSTLTRMQEQLFTYLSHSTVAKLEGPASTSGHTNGHGMVTSNGHSQSNFNCHSTSNGQENQVNTTCTNSNIAKDAGNNSSANCNNKFTTNGRRIYDENFSSASPSGVSNNASEGEEEEETQLPATNDGSSSQLH